MKVGMVRFILILILVVLLNILSGTAEVTFSGSSANITLDWLREIKSGSDEMAYGVAVDKSENVYVVGFTSGILQDKTSSGGCAFVRKYNISGVELWTNQFGITGDYAYDVTIDKAGNIYVVSYTGNLPIKNDIKMGLFIRKYDSSGKELWVKQLLTAEDARAYGIAVDNEGNVYVAATVYYQVIGAQPFIGKTDALLCKYDSNGNELWTRLFGTTASDEAYSVVVDGKENIYVAGRTAGILENQTSSGGFDAFICKFDSSGDEIWMRQFGTSGQDYAHGIALDREGNILLTGVMNGVSRGYFIKVYGNGFLCQYDSDGNELWTNIFSSNGNEHVRGAALDNQGNIYVAGVTQGEVQLGSAQGGLDAFIIKFNSNGNELWKRQFGSKFDDYAYDIAVGKSGNIYIVGKTEGALFGQTSSGGTDAFISKYDSSGNEIWARQFGGIAYVSLNDIALDNSGNIYVTGSTSGIFAGQVIFRDLDAPIHRSRYSDAFLIKYNDKGDELWLCQFGTKSGDSANTVAVNNAGYTCVAGNTGGTFPGQFPSSRNDIFVSMFDSSGNELWTRQFGARSPDSAPDINSARSVTIDDSGNIFIAGYINGVLPGQSSSGQVDAFLRKYNIRGEVLWTQQFGTSQNDFVYDLALSRSGDIYITGKTNGSFTGGQYRGTSFFIRKFDQSGNELWTRHVGSTPIDYDYIPGMSLDSEGNIYITGMAFARPPPPATPHTGYHGVFLWKYNSLGEELWVKQIGGAEGSGTVSVITDLSGNVYITGNISTIIYSGNYLENKNSFIWKLDSLGNELWLYQFDSNNWHYIRHMIINESGNFFLVGGLYCAGSGINCSYAIAKLGEVSNSTATSSLPEKPESTYRAQVFPWQIVLGVVSFALLVSTIIWWLLRKRKNGT